MKQSGLHTRREDSYSLSKASININKCGSVYVAETRIGIAIDDSTRVDHVKSGKLSWPRLRRPR